jgi:hypothetical protein
LESHIVPPAVKGKEASRVRLSCIVEKWAGGRKKMKSPTVYFVLGFVTASVIWLIVLAVLNNELLHTFTSFSGHS